ncbi:MAG: methyltransferase domain-containing protein [Bacteroidetes bacterium]|jgi:SAM-dependent methyltransferase|nr:methyltransferase domain-containing protein [Bacteroidota bacterium]
MTTTSSSSGSSETSASADPWYTEWFDQAEYELVYQNRDEQEASQCIDLIEDAVAPDPGAAILDMGCGRGRHARVLARRGYAVTGVDLSRPSLDRARARAAAEDLPITFQQGDMRDPVCEDCFDGVVNLFTAFGYFADDADHARVIRAMATALRPGGWLVQDFLNAPQVRATLVPHDARQVGEAHIAQHRWIADGRIHKRIAITRQGRTQTFRESVRLLTKTDFARLYRRAGLTLTQTFGHYDGRPYSPAAPRLLLVAQAAA